MKLNIEGRETATRLEEQSVEYLAWRVACAQDVIQAMEIALFGWQQACSDRDWEEAKKALADYRADYDFSI